MKLGHKYIIITILLVFAFTGQIITQTSSNNTFVYVGAVTVGNSIQVNWKSGSESGISYFAVYRSLSLEGPYNNCIQDHIGCKTDKNYLIYDNNDLFKTSAKWFYYKVKAFDASGNIVAESDGVGTYYSGTMSTARRTWGSIKAMFR
jgi:hypothetical protein